MSAARLTWLADAPAWFLVQGSRNHPHTHPSCKQAWLSFCPCPGWGAKCTPSCALWPSSGVSVNCSRWWGSYFPLLEMHPFARSAMVSVAAQKAGGNLLHPMGRTKGTPTRGGSPGLVGDSTASHKASSGLRPILWKPLEMSTFARHTPPVRCVHSVVTSCGPVHRSNL